jgi:Flp pilus assembly protein TadD
MQTVPFAMRNTMKRYRLWALAVLVAGTLVAYAPALSSGFIWDDDFYVTKNETLQDLHGLRRIWTEPTSIPQYYPLVHTTFWVEHRLWGLRPAGYHLVNVLLHAANACLLGILLARLQVPGAWLAAALFALHPVQVESVAWVTERKNVLSGFFYLLSLLAYLRYRCPREDTAPEEARPWCWYALALTLFLCALLSKTVTATLPVVALVILWWQGARPRVRDALNLLPFFALGLGMGLMTALWEQRFVGAEGALFGLSPGDRLVIAGRAPWFYFGKLLWPQNLVFIYPRWSIDAGAWTSYLPWLATAALLLVLWSKRGSWGRGLLAAALVFGCTIFPALGFFNFYPMRYSFVADHFQYLASSAVLAAFAALWTVAAGKAARRMGNGGHGGRAPGSAILIHAVPAATVLALGLLTWHQTHMYKDLRTLWEETVRRNPDAAMAYDNLGSEEMRRGDLEAARTAYRRSVRLAPEQAIELPGGRPMQDKTATSLDRVLLPGTADAERLFAEGMTLVGHGRTAEAEEKFREVVRLNPRKHVAWNNLGNVLRELGRREEAMAAYRKALEIAGDYGDAYYNLGAVLGELGDAEGARRNFKEAVKRMPPIERGAYEERFRGQFPDWDRK